VSLLGECDHVTNFLCESLEWPILNEIEAFTEDANGSNNDKSKNKHYNIHNNGNNSDISNKTKIVKPLLNEIKAFTDERCDSNKDKIDHKYSDNLGTPFKSESITSGFATSETRKSRYYLCGYYSLLMPYWL
jgi:hypothetical protein